MKYAIFCCVLATLCGEIRGQIFLGNKPPEVSSLDSVDAYWFSQKLDHFNKSDNTTWDQRYFMNSKAWRGENSPVFLMVGGEGAISDYWMTGGMWVWWAYTYGALLFQLEHRFYGQSHPTDDASVDNLKYLSSQQAIQDIAYFIREMNNLYNFTSSNKWILFGGSYPGNLVAWARLKLPSLVYGAISSSGPLQAKINFFEYDEVVRTSLDTISSGCSSQVTSAFKSIQKLLKTNRGTQTVINKFNVCSGFSAKRPKDMVVLYQSLFSPIAKAVQYNNNGNPKENISFVCSYMNNATVPDPVDRLAQLKNATSTNCVYANYKGDVSFFQNTDWNSNAVANNSRQWIYQTCNEFGYYQTSENSTSLLSDTLPIDFFTQQCTDIYGANFNANQLKKSVDFTNQYYQGTNIKVDRVVFVQGSIDPWHALGMVKNPTAQSPFIYIVGTSHCQDMNSPSSNDLPTLKSARRQIGTYLGEWLRQ